MTPTYPRCALSGHRELQSDFDDALLERVLENLIKHGTHTFYSGMAIGFDLIATDILVKLRGKYPQIKIIACIPCPSQSSRYSTANKQMYDRLLLECDEKVLVSDHYYTGCMFVRDRYMVENADVLVCYLRKKSGGTAYTAKSCKELNKTVIVV